MKRDDQSERATAYQTDAGGPMRELAYRESDGLEVTLLWDEQRDQLAVVVLDSKTGELFALEAPRSKALDVFNHPFFYAASPTAPRTSRLLAA